MGETMGLDMYAVTLTQSPTTEADFPIETGVELHYWRKHPDLHGWMEELYRAKGGEQECFNCATVVLTSTDLDRSRTGYPPPAPSAHGRFLLRSIQWVGTRGRSVVYFGGTRSHSCRKDSCLHIMVVMP